MNFLTKYGEYWGDRIAWKIGDLSGDAAYGQREGQFSIALDLNVDSETFADYERNPWRIVNSYLDHSFHVMLWRWGIWVAVRGAKINN